MGINFSGSSERLEYTSSNIDQNDSRLSFSIWFNKDSSSVISRALMLGGGAGGDGFMVAFNFGTTNKVDIVSSNSTGNWGGSGQKLRATTVTGQWHHVCGTVTANGQEGAGANSKDILSAYLDGVLMTDTGGGQAAPGSGNTLVTIGARAGGSSHFDGQLAEACIWENSVELTAEEALALAAGAPVTSIQADKIKFYSRLDEINSSDLITGNAVTVVGTPDNTEHAPVTQVPLNAVVPTAVTGAQNLSPTGIASAESFGSPTITTGAVALTATGIASQESFGSPVLTTTVDLSPTGIASAESIGSPTLTVGAVTLNVTGIASTESFGSAAITTGGVTLTATGIASAESFGAPTVSLGGVILTATGIASEESFGSPTLTTGAVNLSATGIPSEESFGTTVVSQGFVLQATGIPSEEAFGTPTITTGAVNLSTTGIASEEAFGSPTVVAAVAQGLTATGIASAESFGSPVVALEADKDIQIDFANEKVLSANLSSTTLYYNGDNYFTID